MTTDKLLSLYIDLHKEDIEVKIDDFIVAIGKKQSNSVYHIAEVTRRQCPKHIFAWRFHVKVFRSNLITAISRDPEQQLIPIKWYPRNKKH